MECDDFIVFEHRFAIEEAVRPVGARLSKRYEMFCRYVCSCGYETQWRRDEVQARRQALWHAVDGQLSVET